jgi:nucleoside-diphosphate-sugar epimerase
MSELNLGNLYELNKQMMEKMDKMSKPKLVNRKKKIIEYINETAEFYYMLLSNEKRDYTVFEFIHEDDVSIQEMADALIEVLQNRGTLISIDKNNENAIEIWLRYGGEDGEPTLYLFFPYEFGVIRCGEDIKE